ncbi:MAG: ABC transporter ATP-binding protein [Chloroflexota bacterium]|nr:ABC transporter ATP-binding protein [Chloroflexota bacterium]
MGEFAVQLQRVTKVYGESRRPAQAAGIQSAAVNAIDLSVTPGEFFTLLGPSGCGKTTTLRLIAGFEQATAGDILIQGKRMNDVPPHLRPVNTVFQNYALFPHLTVAQNVGFGLKVKHVGAPERERRVAEALEMVRLSELAQRKPSQLSGGQQQRVALARAIVNRPAVLLLDEPLGALDLKLRKAMQLELKHLQAQLGMTFIYVTHDQEEALIMSDRIAVMNQGEVLQIDTPANIYERPATRFVADFIGESNFLQGAVDDIDEGRVVVKLPGTLRLSFAPNGHALHKGQDVTLAIRPEKLGLAHRNGSETPNSLTGVVRNIAYLGTDTRYTVELWPDAALVVRMQNVHGANRPAFAVGDPIRIEWAPDDIQLLQQ